MYKIGDLVICKKPIYSGMSRYWFFRLFEKTHSHGDLIVKGESYCVLGLDDDGIPDQITMLTEKQYKDKGIDFTEELEKKRNISMFYSSNLDLVFRLLVGIVILIKENIFKSILVH